MKNGWMLCVAALCAAVLVSAQGVKAQESEKTTVVTRDSNTDWDIDGPVFLRPSTPEAEGEMIIKNIFGWSREKGDEQEREYELEIEYGFAPNHEGILEVPVELGEGRVDGNADLTIGWHWKLWDEQVCEGCGHTCPSFAMRNFVRIPSGVDSSGVDYMWRGLFTWTVTPGQSRFHFNPFVKFTSGDNNDDDLKLRDRFDFFYEDEDEKNTQFGAAVGMDYRLDDMTLMTWDYLWTSRQVDGGDDNHALELGIEWDLGGDQILALATEIGLDGNDEGTQFGAKLSYMIEMGID